MGKKSPKELALKRKIKEANELKRLEKESSKVSSMFKVFWLLVVVLTIVYVADEIASNVYNTMKPFMIFDFFNINLSSFPTYQAAIRSDEYIEAIKTLGIATIPTYIITILLPLYKMLPDRFGRKIFLVLNTVGMGVGLAICMLSTNYIGYVIGMVVTGFFTPNDIQVIYIMEVAPQKHRAKLCSITKGIALLSVALIGVMKSAFYNQADPTSWHMVFLIPVIIALVIGISCLFITKETPVYLEKRMAYLKKSDEERKADEIAAAEKGKNGGVVAAWKYIKSSSQLKWLLIVLVIFQLAVGLKGYEAETIYAQYTSLDANALDTSYDLFLIVEPIVYAIFAFFSGFLSDWMGRKKSCILFGSVACLGELAFLLLARSQANIVLISIANGIMYGGLWSLSDCLFFTIPAESTPTEIRSSVTGLITYAGGINMLLGLLLQVVFFPLIGGSANISLLQLFTFVPFMAISIIIFAIKVKETSSNDMATIDMSDAK